MANKESVVRVKIIGEDYEVEVEFTSESVSQAIKDVRAMLPSFRIPVDPTVPKKCLIHNVPMTYHKKDGLSWYSHRLGDGVWCNGEKDKGG